MSLVLGLKCKECGRTRAKDPVAACDECWGALEPVYDLDAVKRDLHSRGHRDPPPGPLALP